MTLVPSMRLKPGPKLGRGGRPLKENSARRIMRIDDELHDILSSECKPGERFNDTILRIFRERGQKIQDLVRENNSLKLLE